MRVDAYNAVNQIYQTNAAAKMQTTAKKTSENDKFEISSEAKTYQTAKAAVKDAPDVRPDKVAEMKAKMQSGTYYVSSEDIAEKMMNQVTTLTF